MLQKNLEKKPKENLKLIYKIKNKLKNIFEDKRVVTKILKMDENNQYGNAMTKPLPTGSIKKSKMLPMMREFDLMLQGVSDTDKIDHLFIGSIEFDHENANEKELFFNEIYTPIFEKRKFCLQMKDLRSNSSMRLDWMIRAQLILRKHYKNSLYNGRKNCHTSLCWAFASFYKLMNNSNFGYDCCNNADNCFFQPIYSEIEELSYAKRYQNVFDQQISDFVSTKIVEDRTEE